MDIVGPLHRAPGNKRWLVTATDYFTKWIEAEPLSSITEQDTRNFVWKNIVTRFGIPRILISDNGTQFDSNFFRNFCQELGIKNRYSSPAYPQSNGQAKISNKVVLDGIKKRLDRAKGRWVKELPSVLWAYRTTPRRSTSATPFSLAYGMEAVIPLEVGLPTLRTGLFDQGENDVSLAKELDLAEERREAAAVRLTAYQQQLIRGYNQRVRERKFAIGELVLKKMLPSEKNPNEGKLAPSWRGPFKVISIAGTSSYRLEDMDGKQLPWPWNATHLKKFYF